MTSTSRSVALVVGLLVLLVGLWVLHVTELGVGVGANLHRAAGYTQTVELFIKHRWLVYNPATDTIELRVRRDSPMATFYKESFLSADVEAFNQGDRYVFRVENGLLVGVDPHRHSLALPFSDPRLWRGTLTYRPEDGRRARLVGKDVEIELFEPRASLREQRAWPQVVLPPRRPGERESAEGEAVSVYGPRGLYFGRLHLVGDSVVVNHRNATNGGLISISGQEVPQGNRSRLDPGDVLKLEWTRVGAERRYVLLRNSIPLAAPVLSTWIWKNGTFRRAPEEPDPAFAGDVANALDWSLQRRKGSGYEIPRNMGYDDAKGETTRSNAPASSGSCRW